MWWCKAGRAGADEEAERGEMSRDEAWDGATSLKAEMASLVVRRCLFGSSAVPSSALLTVKARFRDPAVAPALPACTPM